MNHIHHDLIVAWAKGAIIENESEGKFWAISSFGGPCWDPNTIYRIKPEPKPDSVCYHHATFETNGASYVSCDFSYKRAACDNLKLTYDGETGKLKSAEILVSSKE